MRGDGGFVASLGFAMLPAEATGWLVVAVPEAAVAPDRAGDSDWVAGPLLAAVDVAAVDGAAGALAGEVPRACLVSLLSPRPFSSTPFGRMFPGGTINVWEVIGASETDRTATGCVSAAAPVGFGATGLAAA